MNRRLINEIKYQWPIYHAASIHSRKARTLKMFSFPLLIIIYSLRGNNLVCNYNLFLYPDVLIHYVLIHLIRYKERRKFRFEPFSDEYRMILIFSSIYDRKSRTCIWNVLYLIQILILFFYLILLMFLWSCNNNVSLQLLCLSTMRKWF